MFPYSLLASEGVCMDMIGCLERGCRVYIYIYIYIYRGYAEVLEGFYQDCWDIHIHKPQRLNPLDL